jgi:N-acetyl-anhydromuramyl-L-alanine amidase AmpD
MFPFKQNLASSQKNKSKWVNTKKYIVLHHTWTGNWTIGGNIRVLLWETSRKVSCHFIVDTNWDSYKLWDPDMILWHAGESEWKWLKDLNKHSVWIEVIWPLPWFTDEERHTVLWLVQHLMAVLWVPKENVIRHKDIAKGRKTDIEDSFFKEWFTKWQDKLLAKEWK